MDSLIKDIEDRIKQYYYNIKKKIDKKNKELNRVDIRKNKGQQVKDIDKPNPMKKPIKKALTPKKEEINNVKKDNIEKKLKAEEETKKLKAKQEQINKEKDKEVKKIIKANEILSQYKEIEQLIKENKETINSIEDVEELIQNKVYDKKIKENSGEVISLLKEQLNELIDEKIDKETENLIGYAAREYDKVNYVIITTVLIENMLDEIEKFKNDVQNNKLSKYEIKEKMIEFNEKIKNLDELYNKKDVRDELSRLKDDFYTQKKDKYNLLQGKEGFKLVIENLKEIGDYVTNKDEKIKEEEKKKQEKINEEEKKKEERKIEEEKKKEELKKQEKKEELEESKENIEIRKDLELFFMILKKNQLMSEKNKENVSISRIMNYYNEFITGDKSNIVNYNLKIRLELLNLFNSLGHDIAQINGKEYHYTVDIDTPLELLAQRTANRKQILEKIQGFKNLSDSEESKLVDNKLNQILGKDLEEEMEEINGKSR